MSKIFLSYRFTGEDPKDLDEILGNVGQILRTQGHEVFCSFWLEEFFKEKGMNADDIYSYCLDKQRNADTFMGLVKSEHVSSGMERESKLAVELRHKYVLLIKRDLGFRHFRDVAHKMIEYDTLPQLYEQLEHF